MNGNSFDKLKYGVSKQRVISLIKDSHDWQKTEGFIVDGVICPEVFEKQHLRILCVLAESYGYADCGTPEDIETQLTDDILGVANWKVKTARHLPTLLWLLQSSLERGTKVTWEEFPDDLFQVNPRNTALLQGVLSKVAWINVKKASRHEGSQMDAAEVYAHALRNQEILREQLQSIAPHLVVVCGEIVFRALHEMQLFGAGIEVARKWQIQVASCGLKVLEASHPRNWRAYDELYGRFEQIYAQLT